MSVGRAILIGLHFFTFTLVLFSKNWVAAGWIISSYMWMSNYYNK